MVLSKAAEHGIRVTLCLAREPDKRFPVYELAEHSGAPYHFLAKICQRLTQAGILESYTGPNGGITLAAPPAATTVLAVVEALDGLDGFRRCVLGLAACDERSPCPLHEQWAPIKRGIERMFARKSLADLAADLSAGRGSLDQRVRAR